MSRYQGMVLSGRAYSAGSATVAVSSVTTPGTAAPFALYNPIGSGVNLVIWKISIGHAVGSAANDAALTLCGNVNTGAAATTGTSLTVTHNFLGNVMGFAAKGQPFSTATLPAAPNTLRPLWSIFNEATTATAVAPTVQDVDLAGEYIVAPGSTISIEAISTQTAGNAGSYVFGISWAEVPLAP